MDELKRVLVQTNASLQALAAHSQAMNEEIQTLRGTFASIEVHMVKLFEDDAVLRAKMDAIEARVEALERRQPPAA